MLNGNKYITETNYQNRFYRVLLEGTGFTDGTAIDDLDIKEASLDINEIEDRHITEQKMDRLKKNTYIAVYNKNRGPRSKRHSL